MRLTFVIPAYYPSWGGAENQACAQATELARRGHTVEVITWRRDRALPAREMLDGVLVRRIDRVGSGPFPLIKSFTSMVIAILRASTRADALLAFQMLSTAYLAGLAGWMTHTVVLVRPAIGAGAPGTDLGLLSRRGPLGFLTRICSLPLKRHSLGLAISSDIARDMRRLGFRQVVAIPNGVEDVAGRERVSMRTELFGPFGIPESNKVVASAGRVVWYKGFDVLLDAWAMLAPAHTTLVIVGSGPEDEAFRERVRRANLSGSIKLVPASSRAADYLAAADVAVVPSLYDGLSNVLLEALISGTPVVATRVSGAVDLIEDGVNGYITTPGDPAALARGLRDALAAPPDIGVRGRQVVLERCRIDHVVNLIEDLCGYGAQLPPRVFDLTALQLDGRGARSSLPSTAAVAKYG